LGATMSGLLLTAVGCGGSVGEASSSNANGGMTQASGGSSAGTSSAGTVSAAGTGGSAGSSAQGGAAAGGASAGGAAAGGSSAGGAGTTPMSGLHADGGQIKNGSGQVVQIHGLNRSGSEYDCVNAKSTTIFDGKPDDASAKLMATWNANAVRVPLNESCWLGINGSPAANSGATYKKAISDYVAILHANNLIPILELHWVGPGTTLATLQQPMPDADHTPAFWTDVATTFAADDSLIFEVYNEPFPDSNRDSAAGWTCWRDGCMANLATKTSTTGNGTYQAAGLQALVTAIRSVAGAKQLILLGGLQYSNALSQWAQYKPTDPLNNLGAAWHIYNYNSCITTTCWAGAPAALGKTTPVVVTELGENDCQGTFVTPLMTWLDTQGMGYLAWSWNAYGACKPATTGVAGQPYSLITSQTDATPNGGFAQAVRDHFAGL
jgi:hypothetical protein